MMNEIEEILKRIGVGPRKVDDPFFQDSYKMCSIVFGRKGIANEYEEELLHNQMDEFPCNVPGCKEIFQNILDYELHYNGSHRFICEECKKSLPTWKILDIHIQETHDNFFQVLAKRQSMYQCFVSGCDEKFPNLEERRSHCISVHKFAKNFRFDAMSKRKKEKQKETKCEEMETDQETQSQIKPIHLGNSKKYKTFRKVSDAEIQKIENAINSMQIETNNPPLKTSNPSKPNSALMFLPRQLQLKSQKKTTETPATETKMELGESSSKG